MNIHLPEHAIDRCHRIGNYKADSRIPRQIIIKFASYKFRKMVYANKKIIKGTNILVREDLCLARQSVCDTCGTHLRVLH